MFGRVYVHTCTGAKPTGVRRSCIPECPLGITVALVLSDSRLKPERTHSSRRVGKT